jgi:membrane protease YdiL (CAAX protease family)
LSRLLPPDDPGWDPPDEDDDPRRPLTPEPPEGPPGGRIFTLEGRPVPSLYLIAWLLTVGGIGTILFLLLAQPAPSPGVALVTLGAGVAAAIGLAAGAGYQLVARADRHPDRYRGPSPLLLFGVVFVLSQLISAPLVVLGLADIDRPIGFLLTLAVVAATYLLVIWVSVVRAGALSWAEMGWPTRGTSLRQLLRDIGAAMLVMVPVTFGVLLWGALIASVLQVTAPDTLPTAGTSGEALLLILAAAIVAPIGEEAFFRGFALTAWWRDLGPRSALIRSATFFAVVHILNIAVEPDRFWVGAAQALLSFLVILPLGLVLGWLLQQRGMVAAITGHITYNGTLLVLVAIAAANGVTPSG